MKNLQLNTTLFDKAKALQIESENKFYFTEQPTTNKIIINNQAIYDDNAYNNLVEQLKYIINDELKEANPKVIHYNTKDYYNIIQKDNKNVCTIKITQTTANKIIDYINNDIINIYNNEINNETKIKNINITNTNLQDLQFYYNINNEIEMIEYFETYFDDKIYKIIQSEELEDKIIELLYKQIDNEFTIIEQEARGYNQGDYEKYIIVLQHNNNQDIIKKINEHKNNIELLLKSIFTVQEYSYTIEQEYTRQYYNKQKQATETEIYYKNLLDEYNTYTLYNFTPDNKIIEIIKEDNKYIFDNLSSQDYKIILNDYAET